jgi:hypothetical protein
MGDCMDGIELREANGVRVAIARGSCDKEAMSQAASCEIVYAAHDATFDGMDAASAQRAGVVTLCIASDQLEQEVAKLLSDLAAKDPLVVRFTQESLRQVASVPWDGIVAWNAAKQAELKALQASSPSPRAELVASFLAGKSKPGLGR